ncbi:MAG TPA: hypothetical protein VK141_00585 [Nitrosomonas sp.]|nr:hypothetical protein [Nitrosomonas sp.]
MRFLAWGLLYLFPLARAEEIQHVILKPTPEISQAELHVLRDLNGVSYQGVLILCPGQNESSRDIIRDPVWQKFAARERLALVGYNFVSPDEDLKNGRGYFVADRGSGEMLEQGLHEAGLGELPLFLYGFSGGAHFAMSFAAWKPEKIAAFCAYSFSWWQTPPENLAAPAVIVCGQSDGQRYGSSLAYFQAGRRQGKPWAWVSLKDQNHQPSRELDVFVRKYFAAIRNLSKVSNYFEPKVGVDNMTERKTKDNFEKDIGVSVLPCASLLPEWRNLHHP